MNKIKGIHLLLILQIVVTITVWLIIINSNQKLLSVLEHKMHP